MEHKLAIFNCLFHRLFSIPLNYDSFILELKTILQVAQVNGFPMDLVRKVFYRKIYKINNLSPHHSALLSSNNDFKYFSLPYLGSISLKFKNILSSNNCKISFKTSNNLKSILVRNKDPICNREKSGVYKLICKCGSEYVGQTGRSFQIRVKEHLNCLRNKPEKSNFAKHLIDFNHDYDQDEFFKILHFYDKGKKLDIAEAFEIINSIKKSGNNKNLNDRIVFPGFDYFNSLPCF